MTQPHPPLLLYLVAVDFQKSNTIAIVVQVRYFLPGSAVVVVAAAGAVAAAARWTVLVAWRLYVGVARPTRPRTS